MSRYIIQPRESFTMRSVDLISTRFTPSERRDQIGHVRALRYEDPLHHEIQRWIDDAQKSGINMVSYFQSEQSITGACILSLPDDEAERMRAELPGALVLRDRPFELIQPRRRMTAVSQTVPTDLWHLPAIGVDLIRGPGGGWTGQGITVAMLDTGVDGTHPEVAENLSGAYRFDVDQWSAEVMAPSIDTYGHGTHVAGLICGKHVGVAPGVSLMSGVMIPDGKGTISNFILALEWAASQPEIQIVNMSAGIMGYFPEMRESVSMLLRVGVLPVVAVGNEGRDRTRSPGNYTEVISVGASTRDHRVASFSSSGIIIADNHQYAVPDFVAPGEEVFSAVAGGGYAPMDGTSMATGIVSGVAALMLERYPDITVIELDDALLSSTRDLHQPADRQGHGLIQIGAI
ncbi:MAG: S8 family serine peptidase [Chloroflexaceae bacterium]|nr:S8 family serine peptidase [Chloroflexaceae bacterium]